MSAAATATAANNVSIDNITVRDMWAYDLLGVPANATEAQLKMAYRKAALKFHPDRNPGVENEQKFQEIGEAYQILAEKDSRYNYDRRGRKSAREDMEAGGAGGVQDAGAMFAQLFGGDRFFDWIGEISLGKDFTKAMDITMTDEEKAEMEAEMKGGQTAAPTTATIDGHAAVSETPSTTSAAPTTSTDLHKPSTSGTSTPSSVSAANTPAKPSSHKLNPEQRKQMNALTEERRKNEVERITILTNKLKDRVRPFIQAKTPGDLENDPECKKWKAKIVEEIEDLKSQSFGIELCRLIGSIYFNKSHAYIKAHKSPLSNILGVSSWWSRMKDKGATVKEGWQFLSSTIEVQQAMTAMEKSGQLGPDGAPLSAESGELAQLEQDVMGKVMLVTWRGTRFEVSNVLRQVVDGVFSKSGNPGMSETDLVNTAKAVMIIGSLLKNVQADETDEERREMERLVASAAAKKKTKKAAK